MSSKIITGMALSCCMVLAGLLGPWLQPALGKPWRGFFLPLFQDTARTGPAVYGAAAVFLLLLILLLSFRRFPRALFWANAALLVLILTAPMQVAFAAPERLHRLWMEHEEQRKMLHFSFAYLAPNRGVEPSFQSRLPLETVAGRLYSAGYFMGMGWYFSLAGGLISSTLALWTLSRTAAVRRPAAAAGVVGILILSSFLIRPVAAERQLQQGISAQNRGEFSEALDRYRDTIRWDRWHGLNPETLRRIGEVYARLGRTGAAEYRLYRGYELERRRLSPQALAEYRQAAASGTLSEVARREVLRLTMDMGLSQYAEGETGLAVAAWEEALREFPATIQPLYYLARAYYDLAQYDKAVSANHALLSRLVRRSILAHVYANLGDCYQKLGRFEEARTHYALSLKMDRHQNFRAVTSLTGT